MQIKNNNCNLGMTSNMLIIGRAPAMVWFGLDSIEIALEATPNIFF